MRRRNKNKGIVITMLMLLPIMLYMCDDNYDFILDDSEFITVTTNEVTNIGVTIAECGGSVTYAGEDRVSARGVCWSINQNPTISDSHTTDGEGAGSFTSNIAGLNEGTTYYVRAYATKERYSDYETIYGEHKSFTTGLNTETEITITVNGVNFKMIKVEGGTFRMGPTFEQLDEAEDGEYPVHNVSLSTYYIAETEVTQELWFEVMGTIPSWFKGSNLPVESVTWEECQAFIGKLNEITGRNFRLPTEAQWEYAARGGNKSQGYKYSGSNNIDNIAWYNDNSESMTHVVKTKSPNELGIYDMSGNVWEWCQDWYGSYSSNSQTNPTGPSSGNDRVYRGGDWNKSAYYCRVSLRRGGDNNNYSSQYLGFRLVLLQ